MTVNPLQGRANTPHIAAVSADTLHGKVITQRGEPIPYASVSLKNSTDAATADSSGLFTLATTLKGAQTLVVSAIGFRELEYPLVVENPPSPLHITLKSNESQLGTVVITAGTLEATDDRLLTIVKPVDVLSNASSTGDIVGAFQNFPGVQRNGGDQSGLFVRGGDASETMMILDGTTVQNPFYSSVPGIGQRSRFNSFQIKGMSFSTGGYSARYGQALSSVLDLQTTDIPDKSSIALGANIAGLFLAGTQRIKSNNALEYNASYTNFAPYYSLAKTNYQFYAKPQSTNLSSRWIARTDNGGLFKISVNYNHSSTGTEIPDPNNADTLIRFGLHNDNLTIGTSFKTPLTSHLRLFTAAGFSTNKDHIFWGDTLFHRDDNRLQGRAELTWHADKIRLTAGGEVQHYHYAQQFDTLKGQFDETLTAAYAEAEYRPIPWFALKPGVRAEYSAILQKGNLVPRMALAIKTGPYSQIGAAGGLFYQTASTQYLLLGYHPGFQQAVHYLANYEWIENKRSFRIEGYYKSYSQLVRERGEGYIPNPYRYDLGRVDNSGFGYAKGIDIFWRDKASIRNIDYWITYSYIDTKRLYQNYAAEATPDYVSNNNLNLIVKYYSDRSHIFASAAYNYASGRPYYNPNAKTFLGEKAPAYQNLSLKVSYLTNIRRLFAAFYVNVDDVTNRHNILGYRYSTNGQFRSPILPPQNLAIFFGVYLSLSQFKKDEL